MFKYTKSELDTLALRKIKRKLIPVLKKTDKFDFEVAKSEVKNYLQTLMCFSESELKFIEKFNHKQYQPELLFDDKESIDRIKNHPMAIWKCRLTN